MNGLVTQLLPIVSAVIGSGAFLAVFTDRRKRASEAKRIEQEGGKAGAEGQVALAGQTLEWTGVFRQEAKESRERAEKAEQQAREANQRADQCQRDRDNDRERIDDLERQLEQLLLRIESCAAGSVCPVAQTLRR